MISGRCIDVKRTQVPIGQGTGTATPCGARPARGWRVSPRAVGPSRRSRARGAFAPVPLEERAPRHPDLPQLGPAPLGETRAAEGMVAGEQEPLPQGQPPPREHRERPVLEPRQSGLLPEQARAPDRLDRLVLGPRAELLGQHGKRAEDLAPVAKPALASLVQPRGAPVVDVHLSHQVAPPQDGAVPKDARRPAVPDEAEPDDVPAPPDGANGVATVEPIFQPVGPPRHRAAAVVAERMPAIGHPITAAGVAPPPTAPWPPSRRARPGGRRS